MIRIGSITLDPSQVLRLVRQTFENPTQSLATSMLVVSAILVVMLVIIVLLLFAITPKRRKIIRRRRYRVRPAGTDVIAAEVASGPEVEAAAEGTAETSGGDAGNVDEPPARDPAKRRLLTRPSWLRTPGWLPVAGRLWSRLADVMTGVWAVPILLAAALLSGYVLSGTDAVCSQTCHVNQDTTKLAVKADHAACSACHGSPGLSGAFLNAGDRGRMAWEQFGGRSDRTSALIDSRACLRCHNSVLDAPVTTARGIRMSHSEPFEAGYTCVSCHPSVGHTELEDYSMSACLSCHGGGEASTKCDTCHIDDPYDATKRLESATESAVTMSARQISYPVVRVGDIGCGGCHDESRQCDTCHGYRMPHPAKFVAWEHARYAAWEKKQTCVKCHDPLSCATQCHLNFAMAGHPGNWKQEHKSSGWDSNCGCHASRSGRTGPMCVICHDR